MRKGLWGRMRNKFLKMLSVLKEEENNMGQELSDFQLQLEALDQILEITFYALA